MKHNCSTFKNEDRLHSINPLVKITTHNEQSLEEEEEEEEEEE